MSELVMNTAPTTSADSLQIADIGLKALGSVSVIHQASFPDSAISELGSEAIRRYYEWALVGPHDTVAIGAFRHSELVGFLVGGRFNGVLSGYLKKNHWYLAWRVATHPWLLLDSRFRARLAQGAKSLRRIKRQLQTAQPQRDPRGKSSFGILAIAVCPDCQSRGVGKHLMAEAERRARRLGHDGMHLSVHPQNEHAIQFYERLGWSKVPNEENWQGGMQKVICRQTVAREQGVPSAEI